jgi:hypothetical protein
MSYRLILVCALGGFALGCGDDGGGGGGVSELFDALNGDYVIHERAGCVLELRGSQFRTRSTGGGETCMDDQREFGGALETLKISGTFSDARITGTLDYEASGGVFEEDSTVHATATVNKMMGRSVDGRFAALAGQWEGTVMYSEATESGVDSGSSHVFVDVGADSAIVRYEDGDGDIETFDVADEGASGISVDGELVSFDEF